LHVKGVFIAVDLFRPADAAFCIPAILFQAGSQELQQAAAGEVNMI
jgi:hypothetical protein